MADYARDTNLTKCWQSFRVGIPYQQQQGSPIILSHRGLNSRCTALFYSSCSFGRTVWAASENISVKTAASVRGKVEIHVLSNKSNRLFMYENSSYIITTCLKKPLTELCRWNYSCSWKRNVFCSSSDTEVIVFFLLKTWFQSFSCFDKINIRCGQICYYTGEPELYYLVLDTLKLCHTPHQRRTIICALNA